MHPHCFGAKMTWDFCGVVFVVLQGLNETGVLSVSLFRGGAVPTRVPLRTFFRFRPFVTGLGGVGREAELGAGEEGGHDLFFLWVTRLRILCSFVAALLRAEWGAAL